MKKYKRILIRGFCIYIRVLNKWSTCIRQEEEERRSFFKVGVNKMSVRPTHDDMATGHAISGAGLLTPLGVDTIVIK